MQDLKEIKIFIASSEELKHERQVFSDLALKLSLLLKSKGIKIVLEKWEYLDSSMGIKHKQDEYNDVLVECHICIAIFWTIFGDFTSKEFNVAKEEVKQGKMLKEALLYFKNGSINPMIDANQQKENIEKLTTFKNECKEKKLPYFNFQNDTELTYLFITLIDKYCKEHFDIPITKVENNKLMVEHKMFVNLNEIK